MSDDDDDDVVDDDDAVQPWLKARGEDGKNGLEAIARTNTIPMRTPRDSRLESPYLTATEHGSKTTHRFQGS